MPKFRKTRSYTVSVGVKDVFEEAMDAVDNGQMTMDQLKRLYRKCFREILRRQEDYVTGEFEYVRRLYRQYWNSFQSDAARAKWLARKEKRDET